LTATHRIKPTSPRCLSAGQPNLGRCSTYQRGDFVQTIGTSSLKISQTDFDQPDLEWQPIQLDTSASRVKDAIDKLSDATEQIRKDNGYAAKLPEERNFVVEGLEGAVKKLESGTISVGYIRDAWARLAIVSRRFAGGTLELVITGAKQAIVEMVKSQGGELLRLLMHLFH
jgi:hypothetical protein